VDDAEVFARSTTCTGSLGLNTSRASCRTPARPFFGGRPRFAGASPSFVRRRCFAVRRAFPVPALFKSSSCSCRFRGFAFLTRLAMLSHSSYASARRRFWHIFYHAIDSGSLGYPHTTPGRLCFIAILDTWRVRGASGCEAPAFVPEARAIAPPSLAFSTSAGQTSGAQTVSVLNRDYDHYAGALQVSLAGAGASQFTIANDGCNGNDLAPRTACTIEVQFRPATTGVVAADLMIVGGNGTTAIPLSGTGL